MRTLGALPPVAEARAGPGAGAGAGPDHPAGGAPGLGARTAPRKWGRGGDCAGGFRERTG